MRKGSWTSVRVEFLDREKTLRNLRRAARRLRRGDSRAQQVLLFGSLVKGDYVPGSDADVLVILETDPRPFMERILEFGRWFADVDSGVEVFPYTREEIAKAEAHPGSFIHSVMAGPTEVLA